MSNKKVLFFIACMSGGGADRVASLLSNSFYENGYDVEMVITSMKKENMGHTDLMLEIPMTFIADGKNKNGVTATERFSSVLCKPIEMIKQPVPASFAKLSFVAQYDYEIQCIREKLKENPEATAIAFLQPSIPMLMLASVGLPNRVIFSERGDPVRLMKHRYGRNFIEKYYSRADAAVFQTDQAKSAYPENVGRKGVVISNPIKNGLPPAYHGKRNKIVVTFCRISPEKNLSVLVKAFASFHKTHGDYKLQIIGDSLNSAGDRVYQDLVELIGSLSIENAVEFKPFSATVHSEILQDAMYVNSSDHEGLSNAMLEAMAIGMPVICTDCPIGGAATTIKNGENGILVPVGDADAIAAAMSRIADDEEFAEKLSFNAATLREELSLKNIAEKWMEIL